MEFAEERRFLTNPKLGQFLLIMVAQFQQRAVWPTRVLFGWWRTATILLDFDCVLIVAIELFIPFRRQFGRPQKVEQSLVIVWFEMWRQ
jgi:hypothetical protein